MLYKKVRFLWLDLAAMTSLLLSSFWFLFFHYCLIQCNSFQLEVITMAIKSPVKASLLDAITSFCEEKHMNLLVQKVSIDYSALLYRFCWI